MEPESRVNGDRAMNDVVARHLGGLDAPNILINGSTIIEDLCHGEEMPDIHSYFAAINVYGYVLYIGGGLAVVVMLLLYLDTVNYVMKHSSTSVKTHTAFVLSVYLIVGVATYAASVVPRFQILAEAICQGAFTFGMYQLFCLFLAYSGGESELVRKMKPGYLDLRVSPCCCWPCCLLPQFPVDKRSLRVLRLLVLQLPIVQCLIYMILLVMWAEEQSIYRVNNVYFQPIIVTSIFLGIWGIVMTFKMLNNILGEYFLPAKFLVLQLVLLFSKLQGLIIRFVSGFDVMPCNPPLTSAVYGNIFYNSAVLIEMILLSIWARYLYKKSLPQIEAKEFGIQQVRSLPTISSMTDNRNEYEETNIPNNQTTTNGIE